MAGDVMLRCLAVAAGGAVGSVARYGLSVWGASLNTRLPYGTLAANAAGCLVMGAAMYFVVTRENTMPDGVRMFLTVGLLGGLTTFSTFSYEAVELYRYDHHAQAVVYALGSVLIGLALVAVGWWGAGALVGRG